MTTNSEDKQTNILPQQISPHIERLRKRQVIEVDAPYFWLNELKMQEAPYQLRRIHSGNSRYYFEILETGEPELFTSVTTVLNNNLPENYNLKKWMLDTFVNFDDYTNWMNMAADRGTLMHIAYQQFALDGTFDISKTQLQYWIDQTKEEEGLRHLPNYLKGEKTLDFMQRSMYSVACFFHEHDVKPLLIEAVLRSKDGFAGALDLVAEMKMKFPYMKKYKAGDTYKGTKLRKDREVKMWRNRPVIGLIDYKSSSGVYDSHILQLDAYKRILQENFPFMMKVAALKKLPLHLFNFRPQDFKYGAKERVNFHLHDQTHHKLITERINRNWNRWDVYLELDRLNRREIKPQLIFDGVLDINDPKSVEDAKNIVDPYEYFRDYQDPESFHDQVMKDLETNN